MFTHNSNVSEEVTSSATECHPQDTPNHVVTEELHEGHLAPTGNKWNECSNNRHETANCNGFTTILIKEDLRLFNFLGIDKLAEEPILRGG